MTEASGGKRHFSDPELMRALAHPARTLVLDHLTSVTDATATECAEIAGLSPSAMSYHLRALAKVGLVSEAPKRGDGRERVWRLAAESFSISAGHRASESAKLAERAMMEALRQREDDKFARWLEHAHDVPEEWYDASLSSDWPLLLTARELGELRDRISELVRPYRMRQRNAGGDVPGQAERVAFQIRMFPER